MENVKIISKVILENESIYVSDGTKREWVSSLPDQLTKEEMDDIHAKLIKQGFELYDNRLSVINAIRNHIQKTEYKYDKKFKLEEALGYFSDYLELADKFIKTQPLFYTSQKIWWLWNFQIKAWEMVDEIDLLNQVEKCTDGMRVFESKTKTEVINALKMRGRINIPKDAKNTWIQFKDTIYDIKTDEKFPATPEYFITNPIPWEVGASEETPEIDKLFDEWVEKKYIPTLHEIIAYCTLAHYPLHRVFCLNGEGRNGKGSYLNILSKFVGKENITSTDFDTLTTRPFEAAKLYKKLVCMMGEINSSIFKRTSLFKKLTGSDMIGFEFKGKDGFDDYNYAKLIIATNKLPESTDKTIGFYSRWMIIDFKNTFEEKPTLLERIPEKEYNNLAKKSIRILKELMERAKFTEEGSLEERAKRYEERSSPAGDFIKTQCYENNSVETPFWEIYEEYIAYLEKRGFRKASKRELSLLLKGKGFENKRVHFDKQDGSKGTMVVVLELGLDSRQEKDDAEIEKKNEFGPLKY